MGAVRFGVPEKLVLWARDAFGIRAFVETGTNRAATTVWAARHFDRVITIEGEKTLYDAAVATHGAQHRNIQFIHGNSGKILGDVLRDLDQPAILWLDAHWCGEDTFGSTAECPLLDELAAVNAAKHDHVVLVDDARYFVAPAPKPHEWRHWPGLLDVTKALSAGPNPRFGAIYEDVIVAVSQQRADALVEFLRSEAAAARAQPRRSLPRRIVRRVLGL